MTDRKPMAPNTTPQAPTSWEKLRREHPDTPEGRREFQEKYILGTTSAQLDSERFDNRKKMGYVPSVIPDPVRSPLATLKSFVQSTWRLHAAVLSLPEIESALTRAVVSEGHLKAAEKSERERAGTLSGSAKYEAIHSANDFQIRALLATGQADALRIAKQIKKDLERKGK